MLKQYYCIFDAKSLRLIKDTQQVVIHNAGIMCLRYALALQCPYNSEAVTKAKGFCITFNLLNKVFCNIHKEVQKIGHSLKSCLVPHFKNKCLFIQEYQIPIFELVVLYLIGPLRKDSSL